MPTFTSKYSIYLVKVGRALWLALAKEKKIKIRININSAHEPIPEILLSFRTKPNTMVIIANRSSEDKGD